MPWLAEPAKLQYACWPVIPCGLLGSEANYFLGPALQIMGCRALEVFHHGGQMVNHGSSYSSLVVGAMSDLRPVSTLHQGIAWPHSCSKQSWLPWLDRDVLILGPPLCPVTQHDERAERTH